jgi:hypothetical protein
MTINEHLAAAKAHALVRDEYIDDAANLPWPRHRMHDLLRFAAHYHGAYLGHSFRAAELMYDALQSRGAR